MGPESAHSRINQVAKTPAASTSSNPATPNILALPQRLTANITAADARMALVDENALAAVTTQVTNDLKHLLNADDILEPPIDRQEILDLLENPPNRPIQGIYDPTTIRLPELLSAKIAAAKLNQAVNADQERNAYLQRFPPDKDQGTAATPVGGDAPVRKGVSLIKSRIDTSSDLGNDYFHPGLNMRMPFPVNVGEEGGESINSEDAKEPRCRRDRLRMTVRRVMAHLKSRRYDGDTTDRQDISLPVPGSLRIYY